MNPPPVQDTKPASEATTYDLPTVPRESDTDPDAPIIYAQKQLYLSSPGLYEAELDAFRDEASLDMYMRYYYSIHVPSLRHSTRPDLRHIEDEVAHYIIWLESVPPQPDSFPNLIRQAYTSLVLYPRIPLRGGTLGLAGSQTQTAPNTRHSHCVRLVYMGRGPQHHDAKLEHGPTQPCDPRHSAFLLP